MSQSIKYYGVAILRRTGTEFLAYSGNGITPAIFGNRKSAREHQKALSEHFECRVVNVRYQEPKIIK